MPAKDWYVIVKIAPDIDGTELGQTDLESYAQDVADSIQPSDQFESTHVVSFDGFGNYVRPRWATDHEVNQ